MHLTDDPFFMADVFAAPSPSPQVLDYFCAKGASLPRRRLPEGWLEALAIVLLCGPALIVCAIALLALIVQAAQADSDRVRGGAVALALLVLFFISIEIVVIRIGFHRPAMLGRTPN